MHRAPLASLLTVALLAFSGCADLPPGETGIFSENAAVTAGQFARAGGTVSAESQATGASSGAIVTATINVIQKHQATEKQRRIAAQRARAAMQKLRARQEREAVAAAKAQKPKPAPARKMGEPPPRTAVTAREVDVTQPAPKKKLPRYIAIDTVKDERTSPQAAKAVMIFDTQTQEIVGNNVYDVRSTPPVGGTARFETFTAEYVGAGS